MINYSIIIPHYNIPDLLMRCLKSIPIRKDIQVIVVDDCSPDFATYKERYPELSRPYLELYQTPRGGSAGRARNIGLKHALGKWILFADADDFFSVDLASIIDKYKDCNADIIMFKADSVDTESYEPSDRHFEKNAAIDAYQHGDVDACHAVLWYLVVWGQMYSRKLIVDNSLCFDETSVCNDVMFAIKTAYKASVVFSSTDCLYTITTRQNSLHDNKTKQLDKYITQCQVMLHLDRFCSMHNIKKEPQFVLKNITYSVNLFGLNAIAKILPMYILEHALFHGLWPYIKRHVK